MQNNEQQGTAMQNDSKQYKAKIQYLNERKTELLDEIEILRNRLNLQEIY